MRPATGSKPPARLASRTPLVLAHSHGKKGDNPGGDQAPPLRAFQSLVEPIRATHNDCDVAVKSGGLAIGGCTGAK